MAHEILIDLGKLISNFDELYAKVEKGNIEIKVVKNGKQLKLVKSSHKEKGVATQPK